MKYKILISVLAVSVFSAGVYFGQVSKKVTLKHQLEYGGVLWPIDVEYKIDEIGDVSIELSDEFSAYNGRWPEGSRFFFDGENLKKIIPETPFEFSEIVFNNEVEIELEDFPPFKLHVFNINEDMFIDGLDLKSGCQIQFKDYVLYAAHCESFGTVYFKRSVELPENALDQV